MTMDDVVRFLSKSFKDLVVGLNLYSARFDKNTLELTYHKLVRNDDYLAEDEEFFDFYSVESVEFRPDKGMKPYLVCDTIYRLPKYVLPLGEAELYGDWEYEDGTKCIRCLAKSKEEAIELFMSKLKTLKKYGF